MGSLKGIQSSKFFCYSKQVECGVVSGGWFLVLGARVGVVGMSRMRTGKRGALHQLFMDGEQLKVKEDKGIVVHKGVVQPQ